MSISLGKTAGALSLILFFALLAGLPAASAIYQSQPLALFDSFYRSGSLVFGGGHVVLPLLQSEVVPPGWVSNDAFLAGYGAAQAVPGPLFTFAAYLGAIMGPAPNGWQGALLCIVAIFLPAFLLTIGVLPFWDDLRRFRVRALGARRRERGRRRPAARRALSPGLDQRDQGAGRFRSRARRLRLARVLEDAALAGGDPQRSWRLDSPEAGIVRDTRAIERT